jgi:hypothetical protein
MFKHKLIISLYKNTTSKSALWVWNTFSLKNSARRKWSKPFSLKFKICEPSDLRVEHLLESILKTYERLKELGFTYHNGKIDVIDIEE